MSYAYAAKAASEFNKMIDASMSLTEQNKAVKEFKLKYGVVDSECGMKMTLRDGKTISLDELSAIWNVDINESDVNIETPNMLAFIEKNKINKVIFGERLTPDNNPVNNVSDLEKSDRVLYRFDDGEEVTLIREDVSSAPDFKPDWAF